MSQKPFECIPFYHPTTIALVDDEPKFLQNLSLELDPSIAVRMYRSAADALAAIMEHQPYRQEIRNFQNVTETIGNPLHEHLICLDVSSIHRKIFDDERFQTFSVVVADYDMPGMDGIELFSKLGPGPVGKILLTGRADEKTAIEAFNSGLIDRFVRKQNANAAQMLSRYIRDLEQAYFRSISSMIRWSLEVESPLFLHDPVFSSFFDEFRRSHEITEFYLTAEPPGFLLMNSSGRPSLLMVQTTSDLDLHLDVAADQDAPDELLARIKEREVIPYFPGDDGLYSRDEPEWRAALYPAEILHGREPYYYALVDRPVSYAIGPGTVRPYSQYLADLDMQAATPALSY